MRMKPNTAASCADPDTCIGTGVHAHCREHEWQATCNANPLCVSVSSASTQRRMQAQPCGASSCNPNSGAHLHCYEHDEDEVCPHEPPCQPLTVTLPAQVPALSGFVYTASHLNHAIAIFASAYNKAERDGVDTRGIDLVREEWIAAVGQQNPMPTPWMDDFRMAIADLRVPEEPLQYGCNALELAIVRRHISHGNKINAIKALRDFANARGIKHGLKEAKDLIEGPIGDQEVRIADEVAILAAAGEMQAGERY